MYIVSACLCGINCKYSGGNNLDERVLKLFKEGKAMPVCPEQLGGLETPRPPAEITLGTTKDILNGKGKVQDKNGRDVTEKFLKGAYETLKIVKEIGAKKAILKANSPSCGCGRIYNGEFNGTLIEGNGITAELLRQNGVEVITEENL